MEREQKPIVIIDESGFDFVLHLVGLATELRAVVRNLDRLAVFIRTLEGDFAGLGLPLPLVSQFDYSGDIQVPVVADRFDLIPGIDPIGLSYLLENWRTLLPPGVRSKNQHSAKQKTHRGETPDVSH